MNENMPSDYSEAYIALGANLGDRQTTLLEAIRKLDEHPCITVTRCSSLYETNPVGYLDQPNFINMVIAVGSSLQAEELLDVMLEIEQQLGRERLIRWGPRTVDLDLLWMNGISLNSPKLTLPHPRMLERSFVLVPLAELVQESEADIKMIVDSALEQLPEKEGIHLWKTYNWHTVSALSEN